MEAMKAYMVHRLCSERLMKDFSYLKNHHVLSYPRQGHCLHPMLLESATHFWMILKPSGIIERLLRGPNKGG